MEKKALLKDKRKQRTQIIRLVLIIIALLMMGIAQFVIKDQSEDMYTILFSVGASVLATIIVAIITWVYDGDNIEDEIIERFDVLKIYQEYNLKGIHKSFPLEEKSYRDDFINSNRVIIVMNDAKAFISNNHPLFTERFKNAVKQTVFIIEDYKQEDIIASLERKNGHEPGYYKQKIYNVIGYDVMHLYEEALEHNHRVSLYLNHNINTAGIILTDRFAMLSIYRVSAGKTTVPHFVFQVGGSEYDEISNDVCKLLGMKDDCTEEVDLDSFKQNWHSKKCWG